MLCHACTCINRLNEAVVNYLPLLWPSKGRELCDDQGAECAGHARRWHPTHVHTWIHICIHMHTNRHIANFCMQDNLPVLWRRNSHIRWRNSLHSFVWLHTHTHTHKMHICIRAYDTTQHLFNGIAGDKSDALELVGQRLRWLFFATIKVVGLSYVTFTNVWMNNEA